MEFVIQKADLVRELQTVTGVVEKRAAMPILANLLIDCRGDHLMVGASDLEVTIRGRAAAKVVKEGSVTLPAAKLHEIARLLPESDVQFKLLERNQVQIACDRTRYKIAAQPRDEFPGFPEIDDSKGVRLPSRVLNGMIERVAFAITHEDPRYSLNGALLMIKDGRLTLVATDGHRLAFASRNLATPKGKDEVRVIVPRKALGEVSKLTADAASDDEVVFGRSENFVYFVVGEHKLTSNVLEGNFPRYENVMPEKCGTTITLATVELQDAVKRVSLLASDRQGRAIRLSLTKGKLALDSKTEVGEAQETIGVEHDGDEMSIGFNARYLLDFLAVVGTPKVRIDLNPQRDEPLDKAGDAGDKPAQFRPDDGGELEYRYIVMPMHI